ncbi:hypothetical protein K8T06_04920, partial [bacterium]|nr:hypothetical protein [bacterium]
GAIGAYEPLSGWHYNNIWRSYTGNYDDWADLGTLAIQYETRFQDQITGEFSSTFEPGAKHYLDQLFQRKTIELGGNQPVVNFHITRLLGNRVVCQWNPQEIANDSCYRIVNGKDYYDGGFMFWYMGQLTFSYYNHELGNLTQKNHPFDRQILLFSDDYFDKDGIPVDYPGFQSFQENVDTALNKIRQNGFTRDSFYIFEHSISLENMWDDSACAFKNKYIEKFGSEYEGWTYSRLAHMNCRDQLKLPENNYEQCFKDNNNVSYKSSDEYMALRCSVFEDSFQYIQHLAANDPHLHIVSCDDMYDMVRPQADQMITASKLDKIAHYILGNLYQDSVGTRLPAYIRLENLGPSGEILSVEYYNIAEAYKLLADAMDAVYLTGQLPLFLTTKYVAGPTELLSDYPELASQLMFSPNAIALAAHNLDLTDPLAASNLWPLQITPAESYMVPSTNYVGTQKVNCAEMLQLMARTYHRIYSGAIGDITGIPMYILSEWAYLIQTEDEGYEPNRKPALYIDPEPVGDAPSEYYFNFIQLWTFKPAQILNVR